MSKRIPAAEDGSRTLRKERPDPPPLTPVAARNLQPPVLLPAPA
jgi:hypothetical protein